MNLRRLRSLAEEVRCPLCLELYRSPRVLSCQHAFCTECLHQLIKCSPSSSLICPVCRRPTDINGNSVESLSINYPLSNIVAHLRAEEIHRCISPELPSDYPFTEEQEDNYSTSTNMDNQIFLNFPPATPGVDYSFVELNTYAPQFFQEPIAHTREIRDCEQMINIAPVEISYIQAEEAFRKWVDGLWFTPSIISQQLRSGSAELELHYLPFYVVEFQVNTLYEACVEMPVTLMSRNLFPTERWKTVLRKQTSSYSELLCASSSEALCNLAKNISDWNPDAAIPGKSIPTESIPFFQAWKQRNLENEIYSKEKEKMLKLLERDNYESVQTTNLNIAYENIMNSLLYLPVYLYGYEYDSTQYYVLISAQTGTVSGNRPLAFGTKVASNLLGAVKKWFVTN